MEIEEAKREQEISQAVVETKLATEEAMKKDHEKWFWQPTSGIKAADMDKILKEASANREDPEITKGKLNALKEKATASLSGNAVTPNGKPKAEPPADLKTNKPAANAPVGTKVAPKGTTTTKGAFSKEESSTLMDALDRYYSPAKDQQPLEREDVQAIVRGVLAPRYPAKKDLERATNVFIEANKNRKKKS